MDWNKFQQQLQANNNNRPSGFTPLSFAFYFCTYFVIIFCNSALISCAMMRFNGQEPSVGDGFRMAMARLPQIFAWALVSATVGVLLKVIENAHEKVGYYISMLLGAAWSIMTFFVVPVLVVEKTGPFEAVSRSMSLLRQTWGEALIGRLGLGFFLFLLFIPVLLLFVAGVFALTSNAVPVGIARTRGRLHRTLAPLGDQLGAAHDPARGALPIRCGQPGARSLRPQHLRARLPAEDRVIEIGQRPGLSRPLAFQYRVSSPRISPCTQKSEWLKRPRGRSRPASPPPGFRAAICVGLIVRST